MVRPISSNGMSSMQHLTWKVPHGKRVNCTSWLPFCHSKGCYLFALQSEECQKPQPPLLLKKVSQYTSHLYCNKPPICIAVLLVPLRSEERETWSVLLPFVSQYASHLYCNTPPIRIAVLLGKSWWLWSPDCSPYRCAHSKDLESKNGTNTQCM